MLASRAAGASASILRCPAYRSSVAASRRAHLSTPGATRAMASAPPGGESTKPKPSILVASKGAPALESLRSALEEAPWADADLVFDAQGKAPAVIFDHAAYLDKLEGGGFGQPLLCTDWIPSTHSIITDHFGVLPVGSVCVADAQGAGRGRGGNVWESPPGCLMFSVSAQVTDGRTLPFLQYVVSLAVVEAVEAEAARCGAPAPLDVAIKWPNDIYARGVAGGAAAGEEYVKIGGLLCTSTYHDKKFNVAVGVGINVDNAEPTTCINALLDAARGSDGQDGVEREALLAAIMKALGRRFEEFVHQGFEPMEEAYLARWMHSGQRVTLLEESGEVDVVVKGLSKSGFLLAHEGGAAGETYELHPDGNSFDFFQGLVRRKTT